MIAFAVAVVAAALLLTSTGDAAPNTISSALQSFSYNVGERFVVAWDNETRVLKVVDSASTSTPFVRDAVEKVLWASVPSEYFVAVSSGEWSAKERDGSFVVKTHVQNKSTAQTIDNAVFDNSTATPRLTLTGSLSQPPQQQVEQEQEQQTSSSSSVPVDDTTAYSLTFSCDPTYPAHLRFQVDIPNSSATTTTTTTSGLQLNQVFLRYALDGDEAIYGFGHQYSYTNLRGRSVPVFSTEQGIGRGLEPITAILNTFGGGSGGNWHTTYSAVPQYVSSKMRSVFLENTEVAYFDSTATNAAEWSVIKPYQYDDARSRGSGGSSGSNSTTTTIISSSSSSSMQVAGRILAGQSPVELIEQFTLWAGRMQPLPPWSQNGAIVGYEGGTATVRSLWRQLQAFDVPIAAFWLQDWSGRRDDAGDERLWWNWELDTDYYKGCLLYTSPSPRDRG